MFLLRSVLVWGGKLDGRKTELLVIHSTSMPKVMLTKCYAQFLFLSVKRPLNICEFYFHPCGIHKKKNDLLVKGKTSCSQYNCTHFDTKFVCILLL